MTPMRSWRSTGGCLALVVLLGLSSSPVLAQRGGSGPKFSKRQAVAGKKAYVEHCADCHGSELEGIDIAPGLVGERFDQTWRGKSAGTLSFHIRRMPPQSVGEPGSLGDEAYAEILAFILEANDFAPGDADLPSDEAALAKLSIPRLEGVDYDPDAPVVASAEQAARLKSMPPVTDEMLKAPSPADWLLWGRTYDGDSFSPLEQINKENVGELTTAWRASLRGGVNMPTPLVHAGIMFLHTFPDTVLALDATNGQVLWRYRYEPTSSSSQKMGLGLHGNRVLVPTSDLHVLALDSKTGELIWDHAIETEFKGRALGGYQLRSAPLVVGNKVIQGVTASFVPRGGFILALDVESGQEAWRFNTIARPGEPEGHTWNDLPLDKRSGGSVWHQGTFDPELNLMYFGIAPTYDTGPLLKPVDKEGVTNDALYTNCTIALDPDTGELVWYYQHMSNDQWDLDWVFERQIATVPVDGRPRKVVMNSGKMAIVEALDAATGEYLFSIDPGVQNVITEIDSKTGTKTIDPEKLPDVSRPCDVCPSAIGARSWPPASYNPENRLLFLPLTESCMRLGKGGIPLLSSGVGISLSAPHPDSSDGMLGRLQAVDLATRELSWAHNQVTPLSTAALATAGGLVFCGDMDPSLKAFDDATGELLWQARLDDMPNSSLVTYSVDERQYIAVIVGMRNFHIDGLSTIFRSFAAQSDKPLQVSSPKGGAAIWVFALE